MIHAPARILRTAAHVLKRDALAAALGLSPRDVPLVEPSDRPVLAAPHAAVRVSLSHTRGAVAVAFGLTPIGVDIETLGRSNDTAALARRYFAPGEAGARGDDPAGVRFARLWTAKEALKKAADIPLFEALARPMPSDSRDTFEAHGARFDVLQPADGYVCAIARMTAC
jgi:4'-phosphopantetheinyl transferase